MKIGRFIILYSITLLLLCSCTTNRLYVNSRAKAQVKCSTGVNKGMRLYQRNKALRQVRSPRR